MQGGTALWVCRLSNILNQFSLDVCLFKNNDEEIIFSMFFIVGHTVYCQITKYYYWLVKDGLIVVVLNMKPFSCLLIYKVGHFIKCLAVIKIG